MNIWGPILIASGTILGAGISAFVTTLLTFRKKEQRRKEEILFRVYMLLLELKGQYFWVASADYGPNREVSADTKQKIRDLAWRIADEVRLIDDEPIVNKILHVLSRMTWMLTHLLLPGKTK